MKVELDRPKDKKIGDVHTNTLVDFGDGIEIDYAIRGHFFVSQGTSFVPCLHLNTGAIIEHSPDSMVTELLDAVLSPFGFRSILE